MKPFRLPLFLAGIFPRALLLVLVAGGVSGCTSVQLTPDNKTVGEYKFGYLIVQPTQSFETVREATKKGFKDMGYLLVQDDFDLPGNCELRARTSDDTVVDVKLKNFGTYTNVKIRHGLRGELALEQQLYQAIAKNF